MASFLMLCYALDDKRPVPYAPVRPLPSVTVQAGDTVTYRYLGEQYTGFVFAVTEYFEQAAYKVFHPVRGSVEISAGQVIGIAESRVAA